MFEAETSLNTQMGVPDTLSEVPVTRVIIWPYPGPLFWETTRALAAEPTHADSIIHSRASNRIADVFVGNTHRILTTSVVLLP